MKVYRVNSTTPLPYASQQLDRHTDMAQNQVRLCWYENVQVLPTTPDGRAVTISDLYCVEHHTHGRTTPTARYGYTTLDEAQQHYAKASNGMQRVAYSVDSRF